MWKLIVVSIVAILSFQGEAMAASSKGNLTHKNFAKIRKYIENQDKRGVKNFKKAETQSFLLEYREGHIEIFDKNTQRKLTASSDIEKNASPRDQTREELNVMVGKVVEEIDARIKQILDDCAASAGQTQKVTARNDRVQAGEEYFFSCIQQHGLDPNEYRWNKKKPSQSTLQYLEGLSILDEKRARNEFLKVHDMNIDFSKNNFLKNRYLASSVYKPTVEEKEKALSLFATEITNARYANGTNGVKTATDYEVQWIGMIVRDKKKIYMHAWSNQNFFVGKNFDPSKDFVTDMIDDGGNSYIDAVIDVEKNSLEISPHGDA